MLSTVRPGLATRCGTLNSDLGVVDRGKKLPIVMSACSFGVKCPPKREGSYAPHTFPPVQVLVMIYFRRKL